MSDKDFIEEIKKYEELYNKQHERYLDMKHRDEIWETIDSKFDIDGKKKWTAIRHRYTKEKKKILGRPSSSGSRWKLYRYLSFLDNWIKLRDVKESSSEDESPISELVNNNKDQVESVALPIAIRKRKVENPPANNCDAIHKLLVGTLELLSKKLELQFKHEDDEDTYFLKSIGCLLNKLSKKQSSALKLQILVKADEVLLKNKES